MTGEDLIPFHKLISDADDLDHRRQQQVDRQAKRISVFMEYLDEKNLLHDFVEWESLRLLASS